MSDYQAKPGTGTGFAMKRGENDKKPHLEMKIVVDRDIREGEEIRIVGWKKDKLTSTGNVQFSLKLDDPNRAKPAGASAGSSRRNPDDDIPF